MAGWRDHAIKERHVKRAIHKALGPFEAHTEEIFGIVKAQGGY